MHHAACTCCCPQVANLQTDSCQAYGGIAHFWQAVLADLGDGPEDSGVYLVPCADYCTGRAGADAVLAILPMHAQPV